VDAEVLAGHLREFDHEGDFGLLADIPHVLCCFSLLGAHVATSCWGWRVLKLKLVRRHARCQAKLAVGWWPAMSSAARVCLN
jgi:hypothetical protein